MRDHPRHRRTVSTLYALGAALLLLGLLFGRRDKEGINRIPLPARMLSSTLVLACALLLRKAARPERRRQNGLVAAGMANGFVGDLIMAEVIPLPEHVLCGMLTFGAGHTCYIRALLEREGSPPSRATRLAWLSASWAAGLLGWQLLVRNPKLSPALNYGALAYGLLLSSMAGLAADLAARDRRYTPVAIGGGLFLASDMILASRLFRGTHFPQIGDVIWLTYISGQALIVGGMGMPEA
ncbi:MAG TPA: lysoplasmalogenase [Roseiflexaceae bacterium]|nr:lysoplasmalogenase [Roseiflexaceae bacterium]